MLNRNYDARLLIQNYDTLRLVQSSGSLTGLTRRLGGLQMIELSRGVPNY